MYAPLIAMALVSTVGAALLSWIVARRLGARWALALPLLSLVAFLALVVLSRGGGGYDGLEKFVAAVFLAAPALIGVGLGIGLDAVQRRRAGRDDA